MRHVYQFHRAVVLSVSLLISLLLLPALAFGQSTVSGSLSSNSPCTLAAGATTCAVTVSWTTSAAQIYCVWNTSASPMYRVTCQGLKSYSFPLNAAQTPITLVLKAQSSWGSDDAATFNAGQTLSTITIAAQSASTSNSVSGSLSSNGPCTLAAGATTCPVTVSWTTSVAQIYCVWNTSASTMYRVSCQGLKSYSFPVNAAQTPTTLVLKAQASWGSDDAATFNAGQTLSTVTIAAQSASTGNSVSGSLSANSPCTLASGASTCPVTVSWTTSAAQIYCVWNTSALPMYRVTCQGLQSNSFTVNAAQTATTLVLKAQSSWGGDDTATFNAGQTLSTITIAAQSAGTSAGADNSTFVGQTVPPSMLVGQRYPVTVSMQNTGTSTWPANAKYQLSSQNTQDNTIWSIARVNLLNAVAPGQTALFSFSVLTPSVAGTYNFQWKMINDGTPAFGQATTNVAVKVLPSNTLAYLGYYQAAQVGIGSLTAGGSNVQPLVYPGQFSNHGNLAYIGSSGSDYLYNESTAYAAHGPRSWTATKETFIGNAVNLVGSTAKNPGGGGAFGNMKSIIDITPLLFKTFDPATANINPNAAADWKDFVDALVAAGNLDSVAGFYLLDEPNNFAGVSNAGANICSAIATIKAYQYGRNIPVMTSYGFSDLTFNNQSINSFYAGNRVGISCYDWVGLDLYESNPFNNQQSCIGSYCVSAGASPFQTLKTALSATQNIFLVVGAGGDGVQIQDPQYFYNQALAKNAEGGPQVTGLLGFCWGYCGSSKVNTPLSAMSATNPYLTDWTGVGLRVTNNNLTSLPAVSSAFFQ